MAQKNRKPAVKKNRSNVGTGVVHIQSTFNNTIVTITNLSGALGLGSVLVDLDEGTSEPRWGSCTVEHRRWSVY